jgi:hypothetical protein
MSRSGVIGVVLLGAALTACGSTGHGSAEQHISIGAIAQRTLDAKSARIEATTRLRSGAGSLTFTGVARFDPERYSFVARTPQIGTLEVLVLTHDGFLRDRMPGPGLAGLVPKEWCNEAGGVAGSGFSVNPTAAVSSLVSGGGTLQRLGTDRLRSVETTQFRVVKARLPRTEIWVDSNDLLRRIQQTKVDEIEVHDYFDYGVATPPITAPQHASRCP